MMVNRVSNVSFRAASAPVPDDFLSRPGAYSKPEQAAPETNQAPKKKHTALKVVAGVLVAAAVIAGSLYACHHWGAKTFDATKNFADFKEFKGLEKVKAYVTTAIGKGGKAIEDAAAQVSSTCSEWWNKLFKKAPKPEAAPTPAPEPAPAPAS
jgi:hypothetical protein